MHFLRKTALFLTSSVLRLSIFILITLFAIVSIIGSPKPLKKALSDSGIYENLVSTILDKTNDEQSRQKSPQEQPNPQDSIPLDRPEIRAIAIKAFPPEFIQSSSEQIIDGVFVWLQGESKEPTFSIDLSKQKNSFIEAVADYATTRVSQLPTCTSLGQATTDNPLYVECKPPNFDPVAAKQKILNDINSKEEFQKLKTFSFTDLEKNNDNSEKFGEKFANVPIIYRYTAIAPYALLGLIFTLSIVYMLVHDSRRKAARGLAGMLIGAAIATAVFTVIYWILFGQLNKPGGKFSQISNTALQDSVLKGSTSLYNSFMFTLVIGCAIYLVIGLAIILILKKVFPEPKLTDEAKENNINKVIHTKELSDENAVQLETKPKTTDQSDTSIKTEIEPKD